MSRQHTCFGTFRFFFGLPFLRDPVSAEPAIGAQLTQFLELSAPDAAPEALASILGSVLEPIIQKLEALRRWEEDPVERPHWYVTGGGVHLLAAPGSMFGGRVSRRFLSYAATSF